MKPSTAKYSRLVFVPAAVLLVTTTVPTVAYRIVTAREAAAATAAERRDPVFLSGDTSACDAYVRGPVPAYAAMPPANSGEAVASLAE